MAQQDSDTQVSSATGLRENLISPEDAIICVVILGKILVLVVMQVVFNYSWERGVVSGS